MFKTNPRLVTAEQKARKNSKCPIAKSQRNTEGVCSKAKGNHVNSGSIGTGNSVLAPASLAAGQSINLAGTHNFASGLSHTVDAASGLNLIGGESHSVANSDNNLAAGGFHIIENSSHSVVTGLGNQVEAVASATFGTALINEADNSLVTGRYNQEQGFASGNQPLLVVGNGVGDANSDGDEDDPGERSNALIVLENGDIIIPKPQGDISMGIFGNPQP